MKVYKWELMSLSLIFTLSVSFESFFYSTKKEAIWIVNNVPYSPHTNGFLVSNGILKLEDINKFQKSVFMYKNNRTDFSRNHSYNTRTQNYSKPRFFAELLLLITHFHSMPPMFGTKCQMESNLYQHYLYWNTILSFIL